IPAEKGGTGLSAAGTSGNFLRSDGVTWLSLPLLSADLPAGSTNYIQSSPAAPQAGASFNIGGGGTIGGDLNVGGALSANIINATTQYNQGGNRVLRSEDNGPLGGNLYVGPGAGQSPTSTSTGASNTFIGPGAGTLNTS